MYWIKAFWPDSIGGTAGTLKVGILKVGIRKVGTRKVGILKVGTLKVGTRKMGTAQAGLFAQELADSPLASRTGFAGDSRGRGDSPRTHGTRST